MHLKCRLLETKSIEFVHQSDLKHDPVNEILRHILFINITFIVSRENLI